MIEDIKKYIRKKYDRDISKDMIVQTLGDLINQSTLEEPRSSFVDELEKKIVMRFPEKYGIKPPASQA